MLVATSSAYVPPPDARITRLPALLRRLVEFGFSLVSRIVPSADEPTHRPPAPRPATPLQLRRVDRAITWALALIEVLTGARRLTTRPRSPALPTPPRTLAPQQVGPERFASENYGFGAPANRPMREAFATQPIGQIVTGICQDLGIIEASELWPADLVAITQTPAEWSDHLHAPPNAAATPPPNPDAISPDAIRPDPIKPATIKPDAANQNAVDPALPDAPIRPPPWPPPRKPA